MTGKSPRPIWAFLAAAAWAASGSAGAALAAGEHPPTPSEERLKSESLDDVPEPFSPLRPRSEGEQDRIDAVSLFAAARMEEQAEKYAEALRMYQRAWRSDPNSLAVLRRIVEVGRQLDRDAEANRYLLEGRLLVPDEPQWQWQLADLLVQRGELDQAAAHYRRAKELVPDKRSMGYVLLTMDAGRVHFASGQAALAAEAFVESMKALESPDEYRLDEAVRTAFAGDAGRRAYALFAEAFLAADMPDQALAAFEKVQSLVADEMQHAFHLAQVHFLRQDYDQALAQLQTYLDGRGASGQAPYELLDKVLAARNAPAELLPRLKSALEKDSANIPLRFFIAERLLHAGETEQAREHFRQLLAVQPLAEAFQQLLAIGKQADDVAAVLTVLSEVAAQSNDLEAVQVAAEALAKDDAWFQKLEAHGRQKQAAGELAQGGRLAIGLLALDGRRFDAAREYFELALADPAAERGPLLLQWGVGLLASEEYAAAAEILQRGINERALPQDNPSFHFFLSGALALSDRPDLALEAAETAARLSTSPRVVSRPPWVLYQSKRYEQAEKAYIQFLERFESEPRTEETRAELRQARLVLSNLHVMRHNLPRAEELLEEVLDEYPGDVGAMNDLGYLWADANKRLERAHAMLRRAVAEEPENSAYRDSLGWVLHRLGRQEEALAELLKASAEVGADGVILEHLGDVQQALGQEAAARESWQKALAALESRPDQAEHITRVRAKLAADPAAP